MYGRDAPLGLSLVIVVLKVTYFLMQNSFISTGVCPANLGYETDTSIASTLAHGLIRKGNRSHGLPYISIQRKQQV